WPPPARPRNWRDACLDRTNPQLPGAIRCCRLEQSQPPGGSSRPSDVHPGAPKQLAPPHRGTVGGWGRTEGKKRWRCGGMPVSLTRVQRLRLRRWVVRGPGSRSVTMPMRGERLRRCLVLAAAAGLTLGVAGLVVGGEGQGPGEDWRTAERPVAAV